MKVNIYNQEGKKTGEIDLPSDVFDIPFNNNLVWQVFVSQRANQRKPIAHTKDRGEIRGGGRKPWAQKGTGRARHGSIRSPLWVGGGVTFGPRNERNYTKKIPKKMKRKALFSLLSEKIRRKLIFIVDKINIKEPKTKEVAKIFDNLKNKLENLKSGKTLLIIPKDDRKIKRAAKNIPDLEILEAKNLSVLSLMSFKNTILLEDSIEVIKNHFQIKKTKKSVNK